MLKQHCGVGYIDMYLKTVDHYIIFSQLSETSKLKVDRVDK
jgi:hypothetical protein